MGCDRSVVGLYTASIRLAGLGRQRLTSSPDSSPGGILPEYGMLDHDARMRVALDSKDAKCTHLTEEDATQSP